MHLIETVQESLHFLWLRAAEQGVLDCAEVPKRTLVIRGERVLLDRYTSILVNAID